MHYSTSTDYLAPVEVDHTVLQNWPTQGCTDVKRRVSVFIRNEILKRSRLKWIVNEFNLSLSEQQFSHEQQLTGAFSHVITADQHSHVRTFVRVEKSVINQPINQSIKTINQSANLYMGAMTAVRSVCVSCDALHSQMELMDAPNANW